MSGRRVLAGGRIPPRGPRPAAEVFRGVVGRQIVDVRWMRDEEREAAGWFGGDSVPVLVLDNGGAIYAQADAEGNGGGWFLVDPGTP